MLRSFLTVSASPGAWDSASTGSQRLGFEGFRQRGRPATRHAGPGHHVHLPQGSDSRRRHRALAIRADLPTSPIYRYLGRWRNRGARFEDYFAVINREEHPVG